MKLWRNKLSMLFSWLFVQVFGLSNLHFCRIENLLSTNTQNISFLTIEDDSNMKGLCIDFPFVVAEQSRRW